MSTDNERERGCLCGAEAGFDTPCPVHRTATHAGFCPECGAPAVVKYRYGVAVWRFEPAKEGRVG